MTEEERKEIEHVLRNSFVKIGGWCRKIEKEMRDCEQWLESLTNKPDGGKI